MDAKLFEVPLANGETVLVRPLSPFLRLAFLDQARQKYPDPDPEPYRRPLDNAFDDSLKEAADDNPAYRAALLSAQRRQLAVVGEMAIRAGVVVAVRGETPAETLARYAPTLAAARALYPDAPADDWLAVVMLCLISTHSDVALIRDSCNELLTAEDIARAAASFRHDVQRPARLERVTAAVPRRLSKSAR